MVTPPPHTPTLPDTHRDEEAQNKAACEIDLLIPDQIAEEESFDEMEALTFHAELCSEFVPYADVKEDEEAARTYTLQRVSRELQIDLDGYRDYRLKKLNRFRKGAAVQV